MIIKSKWKVFAGRQSLSCTSALTLLLCIFFAVFCFFTPGTKAQTPQSDALITAWLNAQTNLQTWSADFIQVRTLKSLAQPLTATGHVWFAAPNRFRWELGNPPKTIAVREADQLMVIYPQLKRAERFPLGANAPSQMKDTLALLDAGFPRSRAELESQFNLVSQSTSNDIHEIGLQPKSTAARKFMPEIKIAFDTNKFALRSTELQFTDGSTMKNVFTNEVLNPKIDDSMFHPQISSDYKITEPLKK
jgi:outer membrane lipoprotein-sorting protein